jgi:allantoinase
VSTVFDSIVRGGSIVTPEGVRIEDIGIRDGAIEQIGPDLSGAKFEIDAAGLLVFPGLIDVHVHFNEPGRADWEGASTGSRALAAGGGTLFFDMPLNSTPCLVNAREFDRKRTALENASVADFGLWGGLVPGNLNEMAELASRGVIGFKAFLCDSGLAEFPRADDLTLYEGMREAARLDLPVAVHAESQQLIKRLTQRVLAEGRDTIRDFLESRPVIAELEAISRVSLFAEETGAKLHIVHVSTGRGVALAAAARTRGANITIETCPHYLYFTGEDLERIGATAKCAPPLRDAAEQQRLWDQLLRGTVDIVASDHSPAPAELKAGPFFQVWGGIAGVQSTLAVLLEAGHYRRGLPLEHIACLIADAPARRFRIANKGRIAPGADADLILIDLAEPRILSEADLFQQHAISPYLNETFRGVVRRTIRRGETIYADGAITAQSNGSLVRPAHSLLV